MKKVYFVRHGESEGNVGPLYQGPVTPLTENGKRQAEFVAERFRTIAIDKIISSPQVRAKDTALAINKILNKPLLFSDLFVERRRPTILIGRVTSDPDVVKANEEIHSRFYISDWKHSDEESFEELKQRAKEALLYLENQTEENILVATHGFFMRIVLAYVILGDELTGKEGKKFVHTLQTDNTGITILERSAFEYKSEEPCWQLVTWNDHAHLGEIEN